ncbi:MAG: HAD-IA family hydrolase [Peptococcaceae bacterium]|nr:HAD-IA family hydrolase [Peptococcaceae bacterium]
MKHYTTFLFDFDGTLLNSNHHVISCFQHAFREVLGVELPEKTITDTFGIPLAEALENLAPEHAEALLQSYRKQSDAVGFSLLSPIDGAHDTLRALKRLGCTTAIVTSKKEVNARAQMAHIGITNDIDLLVGPEKTSAHKPDPAPVLYTLQALGVTPEECLMIGDSPNDILCGKNAHVDTAGVRFTAVHLDSLIASAPTLMIDHLSELVPLAKRR